MKFAEIPHFILTAYIKRMNELAMEIGDAQENTLRIINPDFIYADSKAIEFKDSIVDGATTFTWSGIQHDTWQSNSYLQGPKTSIITDSGEIVSLYYKDENGCYQPINMLSDGYSFNYKTDKQYDFFNFDHLQDYNKESPELSTVEGEFYTFKVFDIWNNYLRIPDGAQIYMRNDSIFHQWLKRYGPGYLKSEHAIDFLIRNYVNVNKPYIYLGSIYKNNAYDMTLKGTPDNPFQNFIKVMHKRAKLPQNAYHLLYYNIKNFAIDCVPEHQRTEKLNEFFYYYFDIAYNEVYSTQKDIPNLIDPLECNYEHIWDLCNYYGYDLDKITIEDENIKRNITKYLPYMLKKRGTYSVMYAIWKVLTANNPNRLNVYERWHKVPLTYTQYGQNYIVQEDDYMDWLHTSYYGVTDYETGAGEEYYREYFDDAIYPKLGSDLSFDGNKIIHNMNNIDLIVEVYNNEGIRLLPENIFVKHTYISLDPFEGIIVLKKGNNITKDDINKENQLLNFYKDGYKIQWNKEGDFDADRIASCLYDYKETISSPQLVWTISHNLNNKYVISNVYDNDGNPTLPKRTQLIDENTIEFEFYNPIEGYVLITESDYNFDLGYEITLSTQYRVEMDLTDYPIEKEKVISKETIDSLCSMWEDFRPTTRTPSYNMILSPKTDLTGDSINNYSDEYMPYLRTHANYPVEVRSGSFIEFIYTEKTFILHNLNSENLIIDLFDSNFLKISDDFIEKIKISGPNSVEIVLTDPEMEYYILIRKAQYEYSRELLGENEISHSKDSMNVLSQFYNNSKSIVPGLFKIKNENTFETDIQNIIDNTVIVYADERVSKDTASSTWNITHSLNSRFLLTEIYDFTNKRIVPNNIKIIDNYNISISFDAPVNGYVLLHKTGGFKEVPNTGNSILERITAKEITIEHSLNTSNLLVYTYNTDFENINPLSIEIIDENNIKIVFDEEITFYVSITRTNLFDVPRDDLMIMDFYHGQERVYPESHTDTFFDSTVKQEANAVLNISTPSTTWNITHFMGTFGIITDFYDDTNTRIKPKNVKIKSSTQMEATFDTPVSGKILLTGWDTYFMEDNVTDVTITHGLNTNKIILNIYEAYTWNMVVPDKVEIIDDNNIRITNTDPLDIYVLIKYSDFIDINREGLIQQYQFNESIANLNGSLIEWNKVVLIEPDYSEEIITPSATWNITHNLDIFGVIVDTYDSDWNKITPLKVTLLNEDSLQVDFDEPMVGHVLLRKTFIREIYNDDLCYIFNDIGTTHNIQHELNSDKCYVQVYDQSINKIYPKEITIIDNNNIEVEMEQEENVFIVIKSLKKNSNDYINCFPWVIPTEFGNLNSIIQTHNNEGMVMTDKVWKVHDQVVIINDMNVNNVHIYSNADYINMIEESDKWNIDHSYNGIGVISDFYDENGWKLLPVNIELGDNEIRTELENPQTGRFLSTYIGDLSFIEVKEMFNNCRVRISNENEEYTVESEYVKNTDGYFYVYSVIPKDIEMNIKYIDILKESEDDSVYHTECVDLYKNNKIELRLFHHIEKKFKVLM